MLRCPNCGRHLAGLRADHVTLCAIEHGAMAPRAMVGRVQIREGSVRDFLNQNVEPKRVKPAVA